MITTEEFSTLPKIEQITELFHNGKEISNRIDGKAMVKLYSLSDYFVEIWYSPSQNIITKITVVDLDQLIHLYENEINLPNFLKSE